MKILEVITLGETGGAQNVLIDLLNGISNSDSEVELDVAFGEGNYLAEAISPWFRGRVIQIPWLKREISLYNDFKTFLMLSRLCKAEKYDLVHCHSSKASWLARLAAFTAGIKRVHMTVHGVPFHPGNSRFKRLVYKYIEKFVLQLATDYIFVSPKDQADYRDLGLAPSKSVLIPNGRPVPSKPENNLRELIGVSDKAPVVCMVARVSDVKDPLSFIRIAELVLQQYPLQAELPHFVLIGDGPLLQECREAIVKEGLSGSVHLLGHRQNASSYFWGADLALLTSWYEACPLVVIEAMATGTPVVASNTGGTGCLVRDGETGYLYSKSNEAEAAKYISRILFNKDLQRMMSKNSLEFYRDNFTVELMVGRYLKHFGLVSEND